MAWLCSFHLLIPEAPSAISLVPGGQRPRAQWGARRPSPLTRRVTRTLGVQSLRRPGGSCLSSVLCVRLAVPGGEVSVFRGAFLWHSARVRSCAATPTVHLCTLQHGVPTELGVWKSSCLSLSHSSCWEDKSLSSTNVRQVAQTSCPVTRDGRPGGWAAVSSSCERKPWKVWPGRTGEC